MFKSDLLVDSVPTLRVLPMRSIFDPRPADLQLPLGGARIIDIVVYCRNHGLIDPLLVNVHGQPVEELELQAFVSDGAMEAPQVMVPAEFWLSVRVKPGMSIAFALVPGKGGGGGGKNPVRTLLSIAVVAASFYVGGWVGSTLAPKLGFAAGTLGAQAFGAAAAGLTTAIGSVLVNSIAPAPKANLSAARGSWSRDAVNPSYSISGQSNAADLFGPFPIMIGTNKRITPPTASDVYTENNGNDVVARVEYIVGLGLTQFRDIRLGQTPIEDVPGVEIEMREGYPDDAPITLMPGRVATDRYEILARATDDVILETREGEEFVIDFTSKGMANINDSGNYTNRSVEFRIDRQTIDVDAEFTAVNASTVETVDTGFVTQLFAPVGWRWAVYRTDEIVSGPLSITLFSRSGSFFDSSPLSGYQYKVYARVYDPERDDLVAGRYPPESFDLYWTSSKISPGSSESKTIVVPTGKQIEICVMLETYWVSGSNPQWLPNNFPSEDPTWMMFDPPEFSYPTNAGTVERKTLTITDATNQAVRRSVRFKPGVSGKQRLRIRRLTPDSTSNRVLDETFVTAIKSISPGQSVAAKGVARIALRAKANEQLEGQLDKLSLIADKLTPVYDPETGTWTHQATSNQSWLAIAALNGEAVAQPCGEAKLDLPMWLAFAAFCDRKPPQSSSEDAIDPESSDTPYFRFSQYARDRRSSWDRASDILATARAALVMVAGKYSVVWDDPNPQRVACIGPENCYNFVRKRTWVKMPHGLIVRYEDEESNPKELAVYRDGYTSETATLYESIEIEGCDNDAQAWREGKYWFAVAQARQFKTIVTVGPDHLRYGLGSMIGISHPVAKWGIGRGRVKSVTVDEDGAVETIKLAKAVVMEAGKSYGIRIWLSKGVEVYSEVETVAGEFDTVTLKHPIASIDEEDPDGLIGAGNQYHFGLVGYETRDQIVKNVRRKGQYHAEIELIDPTPEVHLADQGEIPEFERAPVTKSVPPGAVIDLAAEEIVEQVGRDTTKSTIRVTWRPAEGTMARSFNVWLGVEDETAKFVAPITGRTIDIPVTYSGQVHTVTVVAVGSDAAQLPFEQSSSIKILPQGRLAAPSMPQDVKLSFASGMATIAVAPQNDADKFVLTIATPVSAGASLGGTLAANQEIEFAGSATTVPVPLKGEYTFTLQAANFQGTRSDPVVRKLTQNRAWAPNAVASLAVPTTGGSFTGSIGRTDSGQIRRPSIVGAAWADPESANDVELFNGVWDLTDVPVADLADLPVSWFVGPQLTDVAEWVSDIVDFGADLRGVWWSDQKSEILDFSDISNWNDVPTNVLASVDNRLLKADAAATVEVVLELGLESDLSDATVVAGHWDGVARYGRVRVRVSAQSWVTEAYASDITIHCDAPDEIDAGTGTISGTPPDSVLFNRDFAVTPAVTVTAESGDSAALVTASVSKTGFQVTGTAGSKFVWQASGVKSDEL